VTHGRIDITGGATASEVAALGAALQTLISEARDPTNGVPAVYGSRWRRAAFEEGVCEPSAPTQHRPSWGTT
jgi:hypothetical protein